MHEAGIAKQIIEMAVVAMEKEKWPSIKQLGLRVGRLSGVNIDSLKFCLEALTEDTPLQKTSIEIEEIPVQIKCLECRRDYEIAGYHFLCPECGKGDVEIIQGDELEISYFVMEDDSPRSFDA